MVLPRRGLRADGGCRVTGPGLRPRTRAFARSQVVGWVLANSLHLSGRDAGLAALARSPSWGSRWLIWPVAEPFAALAECGLFRAGFDRISRATLPPSCWPTWRRSRWVNSCVAWAGGESTCTWLDPSVAKLGSLGRATITSDAAADENGTHVQENILVCEELGDTRQKPSPTHDSRFQEVCEIDRRASRQWATALWLRPAPGRHLGDRDGDRGARPTRDRGPLRPNHPNPRAGSGLAAEAVAARDVRVSVVRLPQVHNTEKQGLVTSSLAVAREKGVSAYVGDGLNRWPAVHVLDAARVYRLALERVRTGRDITRSTRRA